MLADHAARVVVFVKTFQFTVTRNVTHVKRKLRNSIFAGSKRIRYSFAHSGSPEDKARLKEYESGPTADLAKQIMKGFALTAAADANVSEVAKAIVRVVDMPFGTRHFRLQVRRKAVKNSKCCFWWCRLQGNAPFISLLGWTEMTGHMRFLRLLSDGAKRRASRMHT